MLAPVAPFQRWQKVYSEHIFSRNRFLFTPNIIQIYNSLITRSRVTYQIISKKAVLLQSQRLLFLSLRKVINTTISTLGCFETQFIKRHKETCESMRLIWPVLWRLTTNKPLNALLGLANFADLLSL